MKARNTGQLLLNMQDGFLTSVSSKIKFEQNSAGRLHLMRESSGV